MNAGTDDGALASTLAVSYAPEPQVIRSRADFAFTPRPHDIARAVLIGAEERSAAMNFFRLTGFIRIIRRIRPSRIASNGASCGQFLVIVWTIPIIRPLPNIPSHVI